VGVPARRRRGGGRIESPPSLVVVVVAGGRALRQAEPGVAHALDEPLEVDLLASRRRQLLARLHSQARRSRGSECATLRGTVSLAPSSSAAASASAASADSTLVWAMFAPGAERRSRNVLAAPVLSRQRLAIVARFGAAAPD